VRRHPCCGTRGKACLIRCYRQRVTSTLDRAPLGAAVRVAAADAPADLARRLAELGLRQGAVVRCLQRTTGGGRVVDVAGARVALGREVLRAVRTEPAGQ
jgi:ferrous iron transport protein A